MYIALIPQFNIEYSVQLANVLSEKHDISLLMWQNICENYLKFLDAKVDVKFMHKPKPKSPKNLQLVYKTIKIINMLKPDIIHIQNPYSWMCFGLPFLRNYPLVVTVHDPKPHFGREQIHSRLVYKATLNYANRVITHGEKLKKILVTEYKLYEENIHVIPHGDFSFFRNTSNKVFAEENNYILFFGRIMEYKGLEYLIKAEPLIMKEIPNAKIVIAGAGSYFNRYKASLERNDNFILYNHFIPNEMVNELFQKASVVVLPYIDGSQTGIIPIAYSFKKPVVVTSVGSIPEVVEDGKTGYIVPPRNEEKLADAIIRLLKNKDEMTEMGENAYKKMKEELSWDKIAEKTIKVYKELL